MTELSEILDNDRLIWLFMFWTGTDVLCDPNRAAELADKGLKAYKERFKDESV